MKILIVFSFIHLHGQNIDAVTHGVKAELRIESSEDLVEEGNADLWLRRTKGAYSGYVSMDWLEFNGNSFFRNYFSFGVITNDFLTVNRLGYGLDQSPFFQSVVEISSDANLNNVHDDPAILINPNFGRLRFGSAIGGSTIIGNSGGAGIRINTLNLIPEQNNVTRLGSSGFRFIGVYSAGGVFSSSDARLKKEITTIPYGIQDLIRIKPVQYYWKNSSDGELQLGLVAQDLEKIIPEAVTSTEMVAQNDGRIQEVESVNYGINYERLLPVMIQAVQEHQVEIEEIAARLKDFIATKSN